jgi:hypothetical protein
MPLVLDPTKLPRGTLEELLHTLRADLDETMEMVLHPRGAVIDASSLETARELLGSAMAVLDRLGDRSADELAGEANLAYATLLATIDLVKSHTDVPRVPPPRPLSGPAAR